MKMCDSSSNKKKDKSHKNKHGRNGIGVDSILFRAVDPVACHYRAALRGAGRVMQNHDGSHLD